MQARPDSAAVKAINAAAQPLAGNERDYDGLLDLIGDARFVLLGEATHGTHEFYAERARITQRLIRDKDFGAVAVEADWPDAYRVNCYVRSQGRDATAAQALAGFKRFPSWMWRNTDVADFTGWLRGHNAALPAPVRVGFYGLDLYSLFTSIEEVLRYLDRVDPAAARDARARYACFDHFDEDSQAYAYATGFALSESCEKGAVTQLSQLQNSAAQYMASGVSDPDDAFFYAQQNARLVMNAEKYYRTMFRGRVASWNLRDSHMADTLDALALHLSRGRGAPVKIVVWAHNSHLGDARATESRQLGEWNLGQLSRENYPGETCLVGFSTYEGTVTAASRWDGKAERKDVLPALPDSYEALLHQAQAANFVLPLTAGSAAARALAERRLERAIGVLYIPATERESHYFFASLSRQFDALVHIDRGTAVVPLEADSAPGAEVPETYPSGV